MATIPLGISVGVKGGEQAVNNLNRIAKASRGISTAGVAAGAFLGGVMLKVAKSAIRYSSQAIQSANDLAKDAATGKASLDGISQGGLIAAQKLTESFGRVKESIFKAFIGSLPMVVLVFKSITAQAMFYYDTIKGVFGPGFMQDLSAALPVIGRNFLALFSWIGDNWRDIAYNMGASLVAVLTNSFENIKRLFTAMKGFATGKGWNFEGVGLMDGANLRQIEGPKFESLPISDRVAGAVATALEARDAKLAQIGKEYADSKTAKLGIGQVQSKATTTDKNAALVRGSVAEASARAQAIAQNQQIAIQRQQLAAQNRTANAVESLASGGFGITEARIA